MKERKKESMRSKRDQSDNYSKNSGFPHGSIYRNTLNDGDIILKNLFTFTYQVNLTWFPGPCY